MAGVASQPGPSHPGRPQPGRAQSNSHIVALLSLKILLLAFFILLNALATFEEERRNAVVESVREAFKGLVPAEQSLGEGAGGVDLFEGAETAIQSLGQIFGSDLPLVERQDASSAWTLQVDVPVNDLFVEHGSDLQPDGAETLRLIAGVLADPRYAQPGYQVDVLYGVKGPGSGLDENRDAMLRAGALVRELQKQGMKPEHLSAGLMPDFAGKVRIHFTIPLEAPAPAAGTTPATGTAPAGEGAR